MSDGRKIPVRTNSETQPLELWASQEVCASLGWTRQQLKLAREGHYSEPFPEPVAVVAGGRIAVWDAGVVRSWWLEVAGVERKREWRRKEAVRIYRRGGVVIEAARQLQAKPDSVRRWLREAGETLPSERDASAPEGS